MLFGSPESFAIECVNLHTWRLDTNPQTTYGTGGLCMWINGERYGDHEDLSTLLNDVSLAFSDALKNISEPIDENFDHLSDRELYDLIREALYPRDTESLTDEKIAEDGQRFGKFDFMTQGGEAFNGSLSFAVPSASGVRLLIRENGHFHGHIVDLHLFTSTIRTFIRWFEEQQIG